jgi:hypothetical protein
VHVRDVNGYFAASGGVMALLTLNAHREGRSPGLAFGGGLVAAAVALHGALHGGEAPVDASAFGWWAGALAASVLVSGGSFLLMRRLPLVWTARLALLLAVLGCALTPSRRSPYATRMAGRWPSTPWCSPPSTMQTSASRRFERR